MTNVFDAQHNTLSNLANLFHLFTLRQLTLIVVSASMAVFGLLTLIYMFWLVRRMKAKHAREVGKQRAGKYGEGFLDVSKRRV